MKVPLIIMTVAIVLLGMFPTRLIDIFMNIGNGLF
jgi:Sec-independent protein translocase protein TatA